MIWKETNESKNMRGGGGGGEEKVERGRRWGGGGGGVEGEKGKRGDE